MNTLYKYIKGSTYTITDEAYNVADDTTFQLGTIKRAFHTVTIKDSLDNPLSQDIDFSLHNEDENYTAEEGQTIYTGVKIINVTYQGVDLKVSYEALGSYTDPDSIPDVPPLYLGQSLMSLNDYVAPSSVFPWYCLSNADASLSATNYTAAFITAMRAKKLTYDPLNTAATEFTGAWGAGADTNKFTLADNAGNVAMITRLAKDWIFAGSPITNFRILESGGLEFNITGITVATRIITVDLDAKDPAGETDISIYLNRVYGSTTSCRHHSEAGLSIYQVGGDKIAGLRHLDQTQMITGEIETISSGVSPFTTDATVSGAYSIGSTVGTARCQGTSSSASRNLLFDSANSPNARTSATTAGDTETKAATEYRYLYTGAYTA